MAGLALSLAFLAGVLLHDSDVGSIAMLPVICGTIVAFMLVRDRAERLVVVLALACVCLGAWRAGAGSSEPQDVLVPLTGGDRSMLATIAGQPSQTSSRVEATIRLQALPNRRLTASLPLLPTVSEGDTVRFWAPTNWNTSVPGQVRIPLSRRAMVFIPALEVVDTAGSPVPRARSSIAGYTTRAIEQHVPEPEGSLTLGIMTGDDSGMTSATLTSFRAAGMSHITAVSGWNVAILAGVIILLLRRLAPSGAAPTAMALGVIWAYAYLVGMQPSVVRASGMATVFMLAHWRGRPGDLLTSLLMTTALAIGITPTIRFDIGFQLSVAATLGIVLLLESGRSRRWWFNALAVPIVAEVAVAPLLLHHLGTYSLISPLANLATAPLVELVMFGGVATLIGGVIHPALGNLFGIVTWMPAHLILAVAERSASPSWSSSTTETIDWSTTVAIYGAMLLAYLGFVSLSEWRRPEGGQPEASAAS